MYKIGDKICFWLRNQNKKLIDFYLYEIISPALSSDCLPFISLIKVNEKTTPGIYFTGEDTDIFSWVFGDEDRRGIVNKSIKYLDKVLKDSYIEESNLGPYSFPFIEIEKDPDEVLIDLIIKLRYTIRRKYYDFSDGSLVDLYLPKKNFILRIGSNEEEIWLNPICSYNKQDILLDYPENLKTSVFNVLENNLNKYYLEKLKKYLGTEIIQSPDKFLILKRKDLKKSEREIINSILKSLEWISIKKKKK